MAAERVHHEGRQGHRTATSACLRVRPEGHRLSRLHGHAGHHEPPCCEVYGLPGKPCAERNRRLRQRQIREGWHLTEEPIVPVELPKAEVGALLRIRAAFLFERDVATRERDWTQVHDLDRAVAELDDYLAASRVRGSLPKPGTKAKQLAYTVTTLAWIADPAAEHHAREVLARLESGSDGGLRPRRIATAKTRPRIGLDSGRQPR
jgi:hypothetical protein